jgi:hypothetical protein
MRFELSFLDRAYHANLLRVRALRLRNLASERTMSATTKELSDEAEWCERQAQRLDDAEEPKTVSDKEPSRVNATRDIIEPAPEVQG